jgi:hypothetical protein
MGSGKWLGLRIGYALREISCRFFMFSLLLGQESGESDDVGFHLLGRSGSIGCAVCAIG